MEGGVDIGFERRRSENGMGCEDGRTWNSCSNLASSTPRSSISRRMRSFSRAKYCKQKERDMEVWVTVTELS